MDHLILMTAGTGSSRFKIAPIFGWVLLVFFFFKSQSRTLCEGFLFDSSVRIWALWREDIVNNDDGISADEGTRCRYSLSVKLALQAIYVFAPFLIIFSQAFNNRL